MAMLGWHALHGHARRALASRMPQPSTCHGPAHALELGLYPIFQSACTPKPCAGRSCVEALLGLAPPSEHPA